MQVSGLSIGSPVPTAEVSRCSKLREQRLCLLDQFVGVGDQSWREIENP
jgi:hypothetical protein